MSEVKLSRASRNVLKQLQAGRRMTNDMSGYHWRTVGFCIVGRKLSDEVVDPLFKAGLLEAVRESSAKRPGLARVWVRVKEPSS